VSGQNLAEPRPERRLWRGGLVLSAAEALDRLGHRRRRIQDLREAHDGHDVFGGDRAAVDLFEEVDQLLVAAELRVVVLDVARRQIGQTHHLDLVDHRFEDPLPRRVLVADRDQHQLVLAVLAGLVAEADRRGLASPLELVREDRRVEVEDLHRGAGYRSSSRQARASTIISRSAAWLSSRSALSSVIQRTSSTSSSWSAMSPPLCSNRKNSTSLPIVRPPRRYQ